MKINPGTQSGSTFSITGKGISKVNSTASKRYHLLHVDAVLVSSVILILVILFPEWLSLPLSH